MNKEIKIPLSEVRKILKQFVIDEVHEGDFDQGNSLEDTIGISNRWWNNNKSKFMKHSKNK